MSKVKLIGIHQLVGSKPRFAALLPTSLLLLCRTPLSIFYYQHVHRKYLSRGKTTAQVIVGYQELPLALSLNGMESSPLARLPAELRNDVYELVLIGPAPLTFWTTYRRGKRCVMKIAPESKHLLALTEVCKEVRAETKLLFFAANTFVFAERQLRRLPPIFDTLRHFPSTIGSDAVRALRHVYIAFAPLPCYEDLRSNGCEAEITAQCSRCLKYCAQLAQVRQWLLRTSSFQATIYLGWSFSLEYTVIDLKDLSKPWASSHCGLNYLRQRDNMLTELLTGKAAPDSSSQSFDQVRNKQARKLETWRDGVKRFVQLAKAGVRPCRWTQLSEECLKDKLSRLVRDE